MGVSDHFCFTKLLKVEVRNILANTYSTRNLLACRFGIVCNKH